MNKKKKISLSEINKELPFEVPQGYFDDFASRMIAQTSEQHVPVRRMLKPWLYMAGMFVGILLLGNVVYNAYQNYNSLKTENYERYLLSQVDDVSLIDFYFEEFTED
ncbi:hypothetical protein D0T49_03860 [Paludibacter sp. 221]|uniref:hypothetical protein n=1 Tax=Paludibacter sp. 221 TaxID=2302939 RepID=UPI0013CF4194|nr:hypothetical protein [Paludibacter sp. 221]NDV46177.1 hypothetical protein [Paludibacter sp. 221]